MDCEGGEVISDHAICLPANWLIALIRFGLEGKKEDVAMLARRIVKNEPDEFSREVLRLVTEAGYAPKILREKL